VSRALWLVVVSAGWVAGCSGALSPTAAHEGDDGGATDGLDAGGLRTDADAGHATGSPDAGTAVEPESGTTVTEAGDVSACASRSGYFSCGGNVCSRAIQACDQGTCEWFGGIAPQCGPCPTCDCLRTQSTLNVSVCDDDGAGGIRFSLYAGAEGDPCKSATDCMNALCVGGVCQCQPAGAASMDTAGTTGCCSGWEGGGTCDAQAGSACTTRVQDCFGGTCSGGTCTCVGVGGYCNADSGCCAGTSRCVQGACQ